MGMGSYSHEAHVAITRTRADLPRQQLFAQKSCHNLMNPHGVKLRESRDSAAHPESLGIVFALDVTGSMGEIPDLLARRELPRFMKILEAIGLADPQLMFLAIGDATADKAPLQVGQFESAAREIDQWLTWSFLEGGGGALGHESYELALYFLAQHTAMDCFQKRKRRGYLIMTGDELPYPHLSRRQVEAVLGDRLDEDVPVAAVVAAVQRTYHPFFLIPDQERRDRCERVWRDLLGDQVICLESPADSCHVAAGLVALGEGLVRDLDQVAKLVLEAGAPKDRIGAVVRALTPYAATLGRDGAPAAPVEDAPLPPADGASGLLRIA